MTVNMLIEKLCLPDELEEIYRTSPVQFQKLLSEALTEIPESETLRVWRARLEYDRSSPKLQDKTSLYYVIICSLIAGLLAKLPGFFSISAEWFYPRFIPLIVFSSLVFYYLKEVHFDVAQKSVVGGLGLCLVFLLSPPFAGHSASIVMSLIHMPLMLGSLLGIAFMSDDWRETSARLRFIRYTGEVFIYTVLILLGGAVLTGLTIGLFGLIGLPIAGWYLNYVVVFGIVAAPLVATYVYDTVLNQHSQFASVLSNVFAPLFLVTISFYLVATIYQGKSPYSDRDFLIIFNGLLIVIWGITVFSISGKNNLSQSILADLVNISLVAVTLLINMVALSAILFRWAEYGITPNRVVVTGANVLIFVNLVIILRHYVRYFINLTGPATLEKSIAAYLPVYALWSLIVVVLLPILFDFT